MPRLKVLSGKQAGKSFDVAKTAVIGRSDTAQVQIADAAASREHCKVFEQAGSWVVADLNSRNGIKVNGVQTTRKNLAHGDKIAIGETVIEFESGAQAAAAPAAASRGADAPASKQKEAAFAAARASAAAPSRGGAATAARAAAAPKSGAGEGGLKVSDRVLQYHRVDARNASVLDVDLAQSAGLSRLLLVVGCIVFLGLVVWLVSKMV